MARLKSNGARRQSLLLLRDRHDTRHVRRKPKNNDTLHLAAQRIFRKRKPIKRMSIARLARRQTARENKRLVAQGRRYATILIMSASVGKRRLIVQIDRASSLALHMPWRQTCPTLHPWLTYMTIQRKQQRPWVIVHELG